MLKRTFASLRNGGHRLEIRNGSGGNAIVKVRYDYSGRTAVSFFVSKGDLAIVDSIPDGRYRIQFGFGGVLDHTCANFTHSRATQEMPVVEDLVTERTANSVSFADLTYTLYSVPQGNVIPRSIDQASFDAD